MPDIHFYELNSQTDRYLLKTDKDLSSAELESIKGKIQNKIETTQSLQTNTKGKTNRFELRVADQNIIFEALKVDSPSSSMATSEIKLTRVFSMTPPKTNSFMELFRKHGQWSFIIPVIGWGVGIFWAIDRYTQSNKLQSLTSQMDAWKGNKPSARSLANSYESLSDRLMLEGKREENGPTKVKLETTAQLLKEGAKIAKAEAANLGDPQKLRKLASSQTTAILNKYTATPSDGKEHPLSIVPSFYYDNQGNLQPIQLNFYRKDNNLQMQLVTIGDLSLEGVENKVFTIPTNDSQKLQDVLNKIFSYQTLSKKSGFQISQSPTQSKNTHHALVSLVSELEIDDTLKQEERDVTLKRSPKASRPLMEFVRQLGQGDEQNLGRIQGLAWQLENVLNVTEFVLQNPGLDREKTLNLIQGLDEQLAKLQHKLDKVLGQETGLFILEERQEQLKALREKATILLEKMETTRAKNYGAAVSQLGSKTPPLKMTLPKAFHAQKVDKAQETPLTLSQQKEIEGLRKLGNSAEAAQVQSLLQSEFAYDKTAKQIITILKTEYQPTNPFWNTQAGSVLENAVDALAHNQTLTSTVASAISSQLQIPSHDVVRALTEKDFTSTNSDLSLVFRIVDDMREVKNQDTFNRITSTSPAEIQAAEREAVTTAKTLFESLIKKANEANRPRSDDTPDLLRQRREAVAEGLTTLLNILPVPTSLPSNRDLSHSFEDKDFVDFSHHLYLAISTLTEARLALGLGPLEGPEILSLANAMAYSNSLNRQQAAAIWKLLKTIPSQTVQAWKNEIDPDNLDDFEKFLRSDKIDIDLGIQNAKDPLDNYSPEIMWVIGYLMQKANDENVLNRQFEDHEILSVTNSSYTVGRTFYEDNILKHPEKLGTLSPQDQSRLNQLLIYEMSIYGGQGFGHRVNQSNLSYMDGTEDGKKALQQAFQEQSRIANGVNSIRTQSPLQIKQEEEFKANFCNQNQDYPTCLTYALKQEILCYAIMNPQRIVKSFGDEDKKGSYLQKKAHSAASEVGQDKLLSEISSLDPDLHIEEPVVSEETILIGNSDRGGYSFAIPSFNSFDRLAQRNDRDPRLYQHLEAGEGFDSLEKILLVQSPQHYGNIRITTQVVEYDVQEEMNRTALNELDVEDFFLTGNLGTGITTAQEKDLALIEVGQSDSSKKKAFGTSLVTVDAALIFMISHPQALSNPGVQLRLKSVLERPGLLTRALVADPKNIHTLTKEIHKLLEAEIYRSRDNRTPESRDRLRFLFELSLLVRQETQSVIATMQDNYHKLPFGTSILTADSQSTMSAESAKQKVEHLKQVVETLPTPEAVLGHLPTLLATATTDRAQKDVRLLQLACLMQKTPSQFSPQDWISFFEAHAQLQSNSVIPTNPKLELGIQHWIRKTALPAYLAIQEQGAPLNSIAAAIWPEKAAEIDKLGTWNQIEEGIYQAGPYQLNLKHGIVINAEGSSAKALLPAALLAHPSIKTVFQGSLSPKLTARISFGTQPNEYVYQFEHQGRQFQIAYHSRRQDVVITQEIDQKTLTFIPNPPVSDSGIGGLIKQKGLWRDNQDPSIAYLMLGPQDASPLNRTLKLTFQENNDQMHLKKIQNAATKQDVRNVGSEEIKDLFGFINASEIMVLGNKDQASEVLLMNLGITLKRADPSKEWVVESTDPQIQELQLQSNALAISKTFGSDFKNFALPLFNPRTKETTLLLRPLEVKPMPDGKGYFVDPSSSNQFNQTTLKVYFKDGKIIAPTTESQLYLAYLFAAKGNLPKAAYYLEMAKGSPVRDASLLPIIKQLGSLIRQLPLRSSKDELFRLKFEVTYQNILKDQFEAPEFSHMHSKERVARLTELVQLYKQVKGKSASATPLLQLTQEDCNQIERYVNEVCFDMFEDQIQSQGKAPAAITVKALTAQHNPLLLVEALVQHAAPPKASITAVDIPRYLPATEFMQNFPSYWNDIVSNNRSIEDIRSLLTVQIMDIEPGNQQAVQDALSTLYSLAAYAENRDELPTPFLATRVFPEVSKLQAANKFTQLLAVRSIEDRKESASKWGTEFLQVFNKLQGAADITFSLSSRPVPKGIDLDVLMQKVNESTTFDDATKERWNETIQTIKQGGNADAQSYLQVLEALIDASAVVPSERFAIGLQAKPIGPQNSRTVQMSVVSSAALTTSWEDVKTSQFRTAAMLTVDHVDEKTQKQILSEKQLESDLLIHGVVKALAIDPTIDPNISGMIDESNKLNGKAAGALLNQNSITESRANVLRPGQLPAFKDYIETSVEQAQTNLDAARRELILTAEHLCDSYDHAQLKEHPRIARFIEMVQRKDQFSNDEVVRMAVDLYVDGDFIQEHKQAKLLHTAIEAFEIRQIQLNGLVDVKERDLPLLEKLAQNPELLLEEWVTNSRNAFSKLELSQSALRHEKIDDGLLRRSMIRLEAHSGYPIRPDQIVSLQRILANPEELLLFRTGGGKSSVIFPLALEILLKTGKLPFQLTTDALFQQFLAQVDPKTRELFLQGALPFDWNTDTLLRINPLAEVPQRAKLNLLKENVVHLQERHEKLQQAMEDRQHYPVAKLRNLSALRQDITALQREVSNVSDKVGELEAEFAQLGPKTNENATRYEALTREIPLMKEALSLNVKQMHWAKAIWKLFHDQNITFLADEPDAIVPPTKEIIRATGKPLSLTDPSSDYKEAPLLIHQVMEHVFSDAVEFQELKTVLIDRQQDSLTEGQRRTHIRNIAKYVISSKLGKEPTEAFIDFMTGQKEAARPEGLDLNQHDWILYKDWLTNTLDTALKNKPGFHYGVNIANNSPTIVPYDAGEQTDPNNIFKNPLIGITYAYLYYATIPFPDYFLKELIAINPDVPIATLEDRLKILEDPRTVFSKISLFPEQQKTNTQHVLLNVGFGGASGTGEAYSLPFKRNANPPNPKELLVSVAAILSKQNGGNGLNQTIETYEVEDAEGAFLKEVKNKNVKAIIDQTGLFTGLSNEDVVQKIKVERESVGYVNNQREITNPKSSLIYFGPKDIRGTDFPIEKGEGVFFFGPTMDEESMLQALGRLRQLGILHTARIRIATPVQERIAETLKLDKGKAVTVADFLKYIEIYTLQDKAKKVYFKAARLKIEKFARAAYEAVELQPLDKHPNDWTPEDEKQAIANAKSAVEVEKSGEAAGLGFIKEKVNWESMAAPSKQQDTLTILHSTFATQKGIIEQMKRHTTPDKQTLYDTFIAELEKEQESFVKDKDYHMAYLPKQLSAGDLGDGDTEQTVEATQEQLQSLEANLELSQSAQAPRAASHLSHDPQLIYRPFHPLNAGYLPEFPKNSIFTMEKNVQFYSSEQTSTIRAKSPVKPSETQFVQLSFHADTQEYRWFLISKQDYAHAVSSFNQVKFPALYVIKPNGESILLKKNENPSSTEPDSIQAYNDFLNSNEIEEHLVRVKIAVGHLNFSAKEEEVLKKMITPQNREEIRDFLTQSYHVQNTSQILGWDKTTIGRLLS